MIVMVITPVNTFMIRCAYLRGISDHYSSMATTMPRSMWRTFTDHNVRGQFGLSDQHLLTRQVRTASKRQVDKWHVDNLCEEVLGCGKVLGKRVGDHPSSREIISFLWIGSALCEWNRAFVHITGIRLLRAVSPWASGKFPLPIVYGSNSDLVKQQLLVTVFGMPTVQSTHPEAVKRWSEVFRLIMSRKWLEHSCIIELFWETLEDDMPSMLLLIAVDG